MNYTSAAIIYNPKSTGSSKKLAEKFKKSLLADFPTLDVQLKPTEYAGHAEKLAYELSKASKHPLIFSSSGDGGYHEVINGAMKAQKEGYRPVTGVLPAGNANDHYHNLHDEDVIQMIHKGKTKTIDLLTISYVSDRKKQLRYAHSYIGFGLTPAVSEELNKTKLNKLKESWLVLKTIVKLKPVILKIRMRTRKYDSIIFSNVDRMSKYFNVSQPSHIADGKFEVTIFTRRNKLKLMMLMLESSFVHLKEDMQTSKFKLQTTHKTIAQADGEIIPIDAKSKVVVSIDKQVLNCLV
jgi:diacylglycerol kinase (ATP)